MKTALDTVRGSLTLPAFLPDATRGAVRTLDAEDVRTCGIHAVMVNVLHLSSHPGVGVVASLGGIHAFMGWEGVVASDSGGFQAYSLIAESRDLGSVTQKGFAYRFDRSQRKKTLTPEKCIERQFQLGADIMFCLDYCTHPEADARTQRDSVDYTVRWATRCKEEFVRRVDGKGVNDRRPLLFAVIQGGNDLALRRECAERLLEAGFDGFGYGGWPIDDEGALFDAVGRVADLVPNSFPKHALGIGKPENVLAAFRLGYDLFDCVIPTRDARHKRLYALTMEPGRIDTGSDDFYRCVYLQDEKHARDGDPVDAFCDCGCCTAYSRAYLHHLFNVNEQLAGRLATIHNLRFYGRLMERLQSIRRHDQEREASL
jgi:queuine tRNA-ribosyltransferase